MKTIRNISVLILLLVVAPGLCFAEMLLDDVSKERAKQLGMEIRVKEVRGRRDGTGTWPGGKALNDPEKAISYP